METIDSRQFQLPYNYPAPRGLLLEHYPSDKKELPIKGGWGYTTEDAVIIDINDPAMKNYPGVNPIKFEYMFAPKRMYEELIFSRFPDGCYVGVEWNLKLQSLEFKNGRMYDKLIFTVTMFTAKDFESLKEDWESHNGYEDDEEGEIKHMALRDSLQYMMEETFFFDITSTAGGLFDNVLKKTIETEES